MTAHSQSRNITSAEPRARIRRDPDYSGAWSVVDGSFLKMIADDQSPEDKDTEIPPFELTGDGMVFA